MKTFIAAVALCLGCSHTAPVMLSAASEPQVMETTALPVNYDQPLPSVHWMVADFPRQGHGTSTVPVQIVSFGKRMTFQAVQSFLATHQLRGAGVEEFFAYQGRPHEQFPSEHSLIALGTLTHGYAPRVTFGEKGEYFLPYYVRDDFYDTSHFLVVPIE